MTSGVKKKAFKPYLFLGFVFFSLAYWIVKLYEVAPDTRSLSDPLAFGRLRWMMQNPLAPIDIKPNLPAILFGFLGFMLAMFLYLRIDRSETFRPGEEHGSAKFATAEELRKFRDEIPDNNMIFSQNAQMGLYNKRLPYTVQLNKNTCNIGTPGDWKTRGLVKPNIMQAVGSFVLTDPKGLTVYEVGHLLENEGYEIKVFDLVNLSNSNQFNVFHYMTDETDIDRVTESLILGTTKSENRGEDFWVQAETLLIRALIGYLYFEGKVLREYEPNIAMVADMLRELKRENPDVPSPVEKMFEALEAKLPNNYAGKQFKLFMANFGGQTLMSVLAVTSARFAVFDHDAVRQMVAVDNMQIETWHTTKTAVFIAIPETDKSYNFIANLMFVTMFRVLPKVADEILQGRHPRFTAKDLLHIRYHLDEFAQLGKLANFVETQASARSREESLNIYLQALNQLKSLYKDDWRTILNNCGAIVYLGTNDEDTMKYFSTRAGKQTLQVRNSSKTYSYQGSSSESIQTIQRDLMTPDEVARIGIEEALVCIAKQNVFLDKKFNLLSHPRADQLADSPEDENWYRYRRYMSDIDEWESNVDKSTVMVSSGHKLEQQTLIWQEVLDTAAAEQEYVQEEVEPEANDQDYFQGLLDQLEKEEAFFR
ncbi:type IV secretory system conjugative DNA transfer family protein [Streptococcus suis]|uniref:VirD4-like conjugal transfer protein, CD1115 family n=1 Tax=Streptococcus suis TaxID=1307 RepID=UPI001C9D1178|nr:type IV secretory system conjugative DNA transfer family protein [Streptococcus suis]QZS51637.1 type IV secretory system conjugative DNA transfer family protein [Streptococcus suis]QZS52045.1 type IV secretory system conjugative DNA transfer family protein [Streptococcus suis]HEM3522863.1 type IV secretory system conjugative DNA transfer family protein [Streptococcus suis]